MMLKMQAYLTKCQEYIVAISLLVITAVVFIQVLSRKVMPFPMPWTEEVAKIALIFLTYLGLAATFSLNYHIRVDLFDFILRKGKMIKVNDIVMDLLGIVFSIFIIYCGWIYFQKQLQFGQKTIVLDIPFWALILAIILGGALTLLQASISLVIHIKSDYKEEV